MYSEEREQTMLFDCESEIDIREHSPLALAFMGDGVYELLVRRLLVTHTRLVPNRLHGEAVKYVSAKAQFVFLQALGGGAPGKKRQQSNGGKTCHRRRISRLYGAGSPVWMAVSAKSLRPH